MTTDSAELVLPGWEIVPSSENVPGRDHVYLNPQILTALLAYVEAVKKEREKSGA